jgi:nitronate monooxygenase
VLASGQVVGLLADLPTCKDLIDGIVADAIERIDSLGALRSEPPAVEFVAFRPPVE